MNTEQEWRQHLISEIKDLRQDVKDIKKEMTTLKIKVSTISAFIDQMPLTLSASVSATEVITENDSNFVVSCTDAAPSVCTLTSGVFLTDPKCWAEPVASGTTSLVSADTTTSVTVERTANSTAFKLFCHGIIR